MKYIKMFDIKPVMDVSIAYIDDSDYYVFDFENSDGCTYVYPKSKKDDCCDCECDCNKKCDCSE